MDDALRQVAGLSPNRSYRASFFAEIATDVPSVGPCFGLGGPAGTTVYVKAGAAALEPDVSPNQFGTTELNIDLGGSQDGPAALTLGTVGNTHTCSPFVQIYQLKQFNREGLTVQSDAAGRVWLVMAIRFWGFEGFMGIYFTQFRAEFEPT